MSTETTNKKIKIDNGTTFGRTYTDKAIDERLQGLVSTATFTPVKEKANNSLQKPAGLTKTKLVGVGTNGQENIEIGDNLTLANGKLSATGGGSGGEFEEITVSDDFSSVTGTITGTKPVLVNKGESKLLLNQNISVIQNIIATMFFYIDITDKDIILYQILVANGEIYKEIYKLMRQTYSHFITMTDSSSSVALYLTIQNTDGTKFTADSLVSYLEGKNVLANGNLHGVVPTYIAGEGGVIKIYYRTPGDNNINQTPDEYQDLSSFTITDLVSPVE